jgi:hypothetical protein
VLITSRYRNYFLHHHVHVVSEAHTAFCARGISMVTTWSIMLTTCNVLTFKIQRALPVLTVNFYDTLLSHRCSFTIDVFYLKLSVIFNGDTSFGIHGIRTATC